MKAFRCRAEIFAPFLLTNASWDKSLRLTCLVLTVCSGLVAADHLPAWGGDWGPDERKRSQAIAARIEREWPLVDVGPVPAFIQQLGQRLARAAGSTSSPWRFTVMRDRSANAFAIGGGRIYISEGTILACHDEAELAAVVAHEMGHQLAGHFRLERMPQAQDLRGNLLALLGLAGTDTTDVAIGSLQQEIDPAKEREADRLSLRILVAAGYDPRASLRIAQRILGQPPEGRLRHLDNATRISALAQLLAEIPPGGRTDSQEFRRLQQQIASEP
jgi:predicted Zn-dependent protease